MNTNDHNWHQMTVMERCEVLRDGQQRIERAIDRLQANKATLDWAEGIDRVASNLLERVAGIENREVDALTVEPGWSVSKGELARLRRVEDAARVYVLRDGDSYPEYVKMRSALDSEPER